MNNNPLVYTIILNWNQPIDTNICINSVSQSNYENLKLVVVDNGSSPDLLSKVNINEEKGILIISDTNRGFSGGCNIGIKYALENNADYILLINNDTTVEPNMISQLVKIAEIDSSIGIVGPIIYYKDQPSKVWFSGNHFIGKIYLSKLGMKLRNPNSILEEVEFISGCGMLIRKDVFNKIGFLNEKYFMYYEDLEFCLRAKKNNFKIICSTKSSMFHSVSLSTGGSNSPLKQYYQIRSSLIFFIDNTYGFWFIANIVVRLFHVIYTFTIKLLKLDINNKSILFFLKGVYHFIKNK